MTILPLLQDTKELNSSVLRHDALKSTHFCTCRYKTKPAHWHCQELKQVPIYIYILPPSSSQLPSQVIAFFPVCMKRNNSTCSFPVVMAFHLKEKLS